MTSPLSMKKHYGILTHGTQRIKAKVAANFNGTPEIREVDKFRSHGYVVSKEKIGSMMMADLKAAYETRVALNNNDGTWKIVSHFEGPSEQGGRHVLQKTVKGQAAVDLMTAITLLRNFDRMMTSAGIQKVPAHVAMTKYVRHYSDFQTPHITTPKNIVANLMSPANAH